MLLKMIRKLLLSLSVTPFVTPATIIMEAPQATSLTQTEMVSVIVEQMFQEFGVTSHTVAKRRRRSAQDVIDALKEYGCWGSRAFTGSGPGGSVVDDLDGIFRSYAQCAKCQRLSNCLGDLSEGFTIDYFTNDYSFFCTANNDCAEDACNCIADFGLKLSEHLVANSVLNAANHQIADTNTVCLNGNNGGNGNGNGNNNNVVYADACCGVSPTWIPYNTGEMGCNTADGQPLELQDSVCLNNNRCVCANGVADDCGFQECDVHGGHECQFCDTGYTLRSGEFCELE